MNCRPGAGEAYGPESTFQAIARLHADRIGHGLHLFSEDMILSPDNAADKPGHIDNLMLSYLRSEARLFFWRTNTGAEVDLLIEAHGRLRGAFEIKASRRIAGADRSGLRAFREDHPGMPPAVLCDAAEGYELDGVRILPWKTYLGELPEIPG